MVTCDRWNYGACGRLPVEQRPALYALDPTHPKTHAWLREALTTYYRWGVRYYMIDFLHAVSDSTPGDFLPDGYHDHRLIRGPQTYRTGLQVIREAAGPDTYLLSSTGATYQHVGLLDACRVGNDYGEGRSLNPESYFYPATFVINSAGFWTSHRGATDALAAGYFTHRKLYLADSGNLLTVDKPIPVGDAQISATIFGINGGPMMLGDDIDRMAEERLALVRQCLPRLPECARPIDLFDSPEPDYVKVFDLPVRTDWDAWEIVAVFNYSPEVLRQTIEPERLGLDPRAEHVVWDFWNERYEGVRTGAFEVCVPPNAVKVLRLAPRRDHPWVLSTDMHVRQGQAEIAACRWDADAMALTLRVSRPAGEEGSVFLHAPQGLAVANPEGLWIAKDGHDGTLIIRLAFAFEGGETERVVRFTER
jgi:alpha-galactosidase